MQRPAGSFSGCLFLTGPTAVGKTAVALELAERLGAEIVGLDSMTVYRGLDIGTAKPSTAERAQVVHHLIDCLEAHEECSVAWYCQQAAQAVAKIHDKGRRVLFVGGTPLYLKALLRGLFDGPPADWEIRHRIRQDIERRGADQMHQKLRQVDPAAAARIHPRDRKRIERALEVHELTGQPISNFQTQFDAEPSGARVSCLTMPREMLHRRINARVKQMFEDGLVAEVQGLLAREHGLSQTARQALGYKQVIAHLAGEYDLDKTIEIVKRQTRRFAKRQMTWFRRLPEIRWVHVEEAFDPVAVAEQLAS